MAKFFAYKLVWSGTLSAGGTVTSDTAKWTADDKYIIEKIFIIERDARTLSDVEVTAAIDDYVFTKDKVPASVFAPDELLSPVLNLVIDKGKNVKFDLKNVGSNDYNIYIVLKLLKE